LTASWHSITDGNQSWWSAIIARHQKQRKRSCQPWELASSLSREDSCLVSTQGDTQAIEELPVVGFEASGALQELIAALTQ